MGITCPVFWHFSLMQSQKSIFLENYQILDIDKCQYLESAWNSTPGVKFSRRFNEILKLPIKFFQSISVVKFGGEYLENYWHWLKRINYKVWWGYLRNILRNFQNFDFFEKNSKIFHGWTVRDRERFINDFLLTIDWIFRILQQLLEIVSKKKFWLDVGCDFFKFFLFIHFLKNGKSWYTNRKRR